MDKSLATSQCPFRAVLPKEIPNNPTGSVSSEELSKYLGKVTKILAINRKTPNKQERRFIEIQAAIPLLSHLHSLFEKNEYILGETVVCDLFGRIQNEEIGYHKLSKLGSDVYQTLTNGQFGRSQVHQKIEAIMMLAINPIDSYLINIFFTIKNEEDFDREIEIARQNIFLMANFDTHTDSALHKYRRLDQNGSFNLKTTLSVATTNNQEYFQCMGVTSGYLKALLNAIIPIYKEKYLSQAIQHNAKN